MTFLPCEERSLKESKQFCHQGPGHGNTLLSCGWEKFQHADVVPDVGDLTLADYSFACSTSAFTDCYWKKWCHHFTDPGIAWILCITWLVWLSEHGSWAGSFGKERGKPLSYNVFNLYHADEWIIRPATRSTGHFTWPTWLQLCGVAWPSFFARFLGKQAQQISCSDDHGQWWQDVIGRCHGVMGSTEWPDFHTLEDHLWIGA